MRSGSPAPPTAVFASNSVAAMPTQATRDLTWSRPVRVPADCADRKDHLRDGVALKSPSAVGDDRMTKAERTVRQARGLLCCRAGQSQSSATRTTRSGASGAG